MVVSSPKNDDISVSDDAKGVFAFAMQAFNKGHCSTHECVARAIQAYNSFSKKLNSDMPVNIFMDVADMEGGGYAVVISGFNEHRQAIHFTEVLNEKCK